MVWFQGRLYVGVSRANLHLGRLRRTAYKWPAYPVKCPTDLLDLDTRARIKRWDPKDGSWQSRQKMKPTWLIFSSTAPTICQ